MSKITNVKPEKSYPVGVTPHGGHKTAKPDGYVKPQPADPKVLRSSIFPINENQDSDAVKQARRFVERRNRGEHSNESQVAETEEQMAIRAETRRWLEKNKKLKGGK